MTKFRLNPDALELLSGEVDFAILVRGKNYVAWSKTGEGPPRPEYAAAVADVRDMLDRERALAFNG